MQYEIRIWKDAKKMPIIIPRKAADRLGGIADSIKARAKNILGAGSTGSNPDILIDKNSGGEDTITSVDISYRMQEVEKANGAGKKKVLAVKINIKGNLYLPLKEDGLTGAAKSMVGMAKDENKIRDTLLLSKWASVLPEEDESKHFYRGIIISVLTKAGDFRVITAKNVYIESYKENYKEGEFGTFELQLAERVDAWGQLKVEGLGYEEVPLLKSVGDKLEKAAKVVATVGTVAAGVGAVGKTITTTVEKFTGETAATRWIKYGFDTASTAGNVANTTSGILKKPKDVKTWTDGITSLNKDVNERITTGVDTKKAVLEAEKKKAAADTKTTTTDTDTKTIPTDTDTKTIPTDTDTKTIPTDTDTKTIPTDTDTKTTPSTNTVSTNKTKNNLDLGTRINDAANKKNGNS